MMDDNDLARAPLLRVCLQQPSVRGDVNAGIGHEAFHVYLYLGERPLFACVVLAVKDNAFLERTGFWWHAVDDQWPHFDVATAVRAWCAYNFPDVAVPTFELSIR